MNGAPSRENAARRPRSVWIVGAAGMLGRELVPLCRERLPEAEVSALDLPEFDITDAEAVEAALRRTRPQLVINAAAYTDVDGCESHELEARAVNASGPANLARACRAHGARLVHVSTDFVFDGRKRSPYEPDDPVHPLSAYGRTKAEGEELVRAVLPDHVIVRTSWLFGPHGRNFVKTILRLSAERDELQVVDDQVGCPTYAPDLAAALLALALGGHTGTVHFCNDGACSWHGFASEIVRLAGHTARVRPITSAQLSRPAVRPAYSVLSTQSFRQAAGIAPRPWQEALELCVGQLQSSSAPAGRAPAAPPA